MNRPYQSHEIIEAIESVTGVTLDEICSTSRAVQITDARRRIAFCMRVFGRWSFPEISRMIGRSGHSTACTAYHTYLRDTEPDEREMMLQAVREKITGIRISQVTYADLTVPRADDSFASIVSDLETNPFANRHQMAERMIRALREYKAKVAHVANGMIDRKVKEALSA